MIRVFLVASGVLASSLMAAHAVTQDAPIHGEPWVRGTRVAAEATAATRADPNARLAAAAVMG
jgi:hypothetical protein